MYAVSRDDALFCEDRNAKTPTLEDHTHTHLRGPEKLVRTYVYMEKNVMMKLEDTREIVASCSAKPSACCCQVYF